MQHFAAFMLVNESRITVFMLVTPESHEFLVQSSTSNNSYAKRIMYSANCLDTFEITMKNFKLNWWHAFQLLSVITSKIFRQLKSIFV